MRAGDIESAAGLALAVLEPVDGADWSVPAGDLEWSCGATLADYQPQDDVRVHLDPDGHPFCLYLDGE
jgi:hypothetical protein